MALPLPPADTHQVTLWDQYGDDVESMLLVAGGILIYALIVNLFYQIISKRAMFAGKKMGEEVVSGGIGRGLLYVLLFPLVSFLFFLLLSLALLFLSSEDTQSPTLIFTLAMAIVAAVRVAAYFSEATSHDVAKMLPLGLLGVFITQFNVTDLASSVEQLTLVADHMELIAIFFAVVVVLEFTLRIYLIIFTSMRKTKLAKAMKFQLRGPKPPTPPQQPRGGQEFTSRPPPQQSHGPPGRPGGPPRPPGPPGQGRDGRDPPYGR